MKRIVRSVPGAAPVLALLLAVVVPISPAADPPPLAAPPSIEDLIRDLGSPLFATREKANERLWRKGRAAIPALHRAAIDPNPEVSRRALAVLTRFDWYEFPDTPPEVLKELAAFRIGQPAERKDALGRLLQLGTHGRAAARAVLSQDLPPETRNPLAAHLTTLLRHEIPLLLFEGKWDEAADRLTLHTSGTTPEGAADYAAFQVLRGTLPAAITDAETVRRTTRRTEAADLLLAHLYRANRVWPKARAAAAAIDKARADRADPNQTAENTLVRMLLEEEGDWPALLADPPAELNLPAGYRLTFLRLAGKTKDFDTEVKNTREFGTIAVSPESERDAAYALLLNDRIEDAVAFLRENPLNPGLLAEILIARLRYQEALDIAAAEPNEGASPERCEFDLRRARVLALIGRRDEAVKLFGTVAAQLRTLPQEGIHRASSPLQRALIRAELRSGLRELACEHAALYVHDRTAAATQTNEGETLFDLLFGRDAEAGKYLYHTLRSHRNEYPQPGATMLRVRELLTGTAPKEAADDAVKWLTDETFGEVPNGRSELDTTARQRKVTRLSTLASVCRAARRWDEAEAAFAAAAEAAADGPDLIGARAWVFGTSDAYRPWLEYADFLFDRSRFADAAAKYEAGWKRFPDQPLLLFLSGRALVKAGRVDEGTRRMDLSHWVALGNERARGKFLEELVKRGEVKAAQRETDLLLRACWSRDFYFGNVMNQAARASVLAKDWPTAERCVQRSLFVLVKTPGVQFLDPAAYLNVPHEMAGFRVRGLLAAGKVDEAMTRARAFLDITPGHVELVTGLVPDLDKLGRKAEADELYGRVRAAYRKVLADYPDSPAARNALAALGAGCRRDLDPALAYAKQAVAADPKSTSYRETLAEVHFRRGERDAAVSLITKLAEEQPRSRLYRRQLTRYKSGDVNSPIPESEE